jgi:hypothetical protein
MSRIWYLQTFDVWHKHEGVQKPQLVVTLQVFLGFAFKCASTALTIVVAPQESLVNSDDSGANRSPSNSYFDALPAGKKTMERPNRLVTDVELEPLATSI